MTETGITDSQKSQLDKFKEAARDLECDDDDKLFKDRLGKMVKRNPLPETPKA